MFRVTPCTLSIDLQLTEEGISYNVYDRSPIKKRLKEKKRKKGKKKKKKKRKRKKKKADVMMMMMS